MNNQFQQQMSLIRQNNERKRLAELQSKYQTTPDYTNMSLRDELNTRYEIGEMNQLQQKYPPENKLLKSVHNQNIEKKQQNSTHAFGIKYGEPSVQEAIKASQWITDVPVTDEVKHQYVSCIGSSGGPLARVETFAGGAMKEVGDFFKKAVNRQQRKAYGGITGIAQDGIKDMKNNLKGILQGTQALSPQDCEILLPQEWRYKRY